MPKNTNKPKRAASASRRNSPSRSGAIKRSSDPKVPFLRRKIDFKLAVFIVAFAAIGAYFIIRSQAADAKNYVLADTATNLTTQTNGPRVITEDTGNKRNSRVVYVAAATNAINAVKVGHQADKAGDYSICATGRQSGGGTAKLVVSTTVNSISPASRSQAYAATNDYAGNCFEFTVDKPGVINIDNQVSGGAWKFALVAVKLVKEKPSVVDTPTSKFPTPQTTGWQPTGVTLSPYTGPCDITTANTIIDSKDIRCKLTINANNVRITRSRISAGSGHLITHRSGVGLTISDSEITSTSPGGDGRAIADWGGSGLTVQRSYIHNVLRGIEPGRDVLIEYSYIGDLNNPTDSHTTAIGVNGGSNNVTLRGNYLACATNQCSSSISAYPENQFGGPNSNWTIEGNLINTTGGYCMYMGYTPSAGEMPNRNMKVINNVFGNQFNAKCGRYGFYSWANETIGSTPNANGNVFSGNVDGNGKPI